MDGPQTESDPDEANPGLPGPDASQNDAEDMERIRNLPKEFGVLLLVVGVGGLLLPGPIGTPFLLVGGVVLWPRVFERVEIRVHKRFPRFHYEGVRQIKRFLDDLERRYPVSSS